VQSIKLDMVLFTVYVIDVGLHDHDEMFRGVSLSEDMKRICAAIGFRDPRMLQSMIICKQPEIGGKGISPNGHGGITGSPKSSRFCVFVY